MKNLNLNELEAINGGGTVGGVILGACTGLGIAGLIGLIVIPEPTSKVVAGACIVNGVATYFDWW